MANRWKGNLVSATAATSSGTAYTGKADGAWGLNSQIQQKQSGLWADGIGAPSAPTIGTAVAANSKVNVAFTGSSTSGASGSLTYTATSTPDNITNSGSSSPILVTGLTNGTSYTFKVKATNSIGLDSPESASSNAVTPGIVNIPIEYLIVAGGGGAGTMAGGGGGGGGAIQGTVSVPDGVSYSISVGAGGGGALAASSRGTNGNTSSISSITTATGGGGGGSNSAINGNSGGSGGGGSGTGAPGSGGAGISGQGYKGGDNLGSPPVYGSGGGGGAGAIGQDGSSSGGGNGGTGIATSISGTSTYYAGGGGGSTYNSSGYSGSGGSGGGGNGNISTNGTAGTANSGGGGGGSGFSASSGGNGGSGIVIIRYSDIFSAAASTTGNPTITVTGGYRIYKFTTSGSITF